MPSRNVDPKTGKYLTKLTPETKSAIITALASGVPVEVAAAYAGVVKVTFYNWLNAGRKAIAEANGNLAEVLATDPYAQFAIEVEEAQATFIVGNSTHIANAGTRDTEGQWQALAWQLERRFPQWFGRKARLEHTGPGGGPIQHEHAVVLSIPRGAWEALSIDERQQFSSLLAKIEGEVVEGEGHEVLALSP